MKQLAELRDKYDLHMTVERFVSDEYESDEKYLLRWTEQIACCGRSEVLHDLSFGCSALFLSELIRFM